MLNVYKGQFQIIQKFVSYNAEGLYSAAVPNVQAALIYTNTNTTSSKLDRVVLFYTKLVSFSIIYLISMVKYHYITLSPNLHKYLHTALRNNIFGPGFCISF